MNLDWTTGVVNMTWLHSNPCSTNAPPIQLNWCQGARWQSSSPPWKQTTATWSVAARAMHQVHYTIRYPKPLEMRVCEGSTFWCDAMPSHTFSWRANWGGRPHLLVQFVVIQFMGASLTLGLQSLLKQAQRWFHDTQHTFTLRAHCLGQWMLQRSSTILDCCLWTCTKRYVSST